MDNVVFNTHKTSATRFWLAIIILGAICLRVAVAFFLGDHVVEMPGTQDQISYDTLAQRVVGGYGFSFPIDWWPATRAGEPTAHWSYLYTFYLAAVYSLVGYHPLIARLIQAVLAGILMPWFAYRLGRHYFGDRVGLMTAGLTAFYAYFVYYAAALMTETFYVVAIMWSLDLTRQLGQTFPKPSSTSFFSFLFRPEWFLLGLALAVTVLLRQVFLLFIPFLYGWLLWRSYRYQTRPVGQTLGILAGATLILILAVAPWTFRNYQAFGRFVLLNTNAGFAFFWGNHPVHGYNFISILRADGGPSYQDLIPPELVRLNEAELDQALLKRGLGFIQADPVRYLVLSFSRIKDYFQFWPSADSGLISNLSRVFSFGLLWPFMLYGLVRNFRRSLSAEILVLYLFVTSYTLIHLLSWALIRYRLPVDAVLLLFAGVVLLELYEKFKRRLVKPAKTFASSSLHLGD